MTAVANSRTTAFHQLSIGSVTPASADGSAVAIELQVPVELRGAYAFTPGQYVTVRFFLDGRQLRRTYSICSTPAELLERGVLRLGVRRIPGGAFAAFIDSLSDGTALDVHTPAGAFGVAPRSSRHRRYAAIAAGSGITPVLPVVAHALAVEQQSTFALIYANRTVASMMFLDQLAELKDRFLHRFEVFHLVSREPRREGLGTGRPDPATLRVLLPAILDPIAVEEWLLCGSQQLCASAAAVIGELGGGAATIDTELFFAESPGPAGAGPAATQESTQVGSGSLTTILDGRSVLTALLPDRSVLESALAGDPELPYSCSTGVCGTCRARVVAGEVDVGTPWALTPEELADGQILTCQARPRSDALTINFDLT